MFTPGRDKRPVKSMVVGRPILLALEDIEGGPSFLEKALRFLEKYGKLHVNCYCDTLLHYHLHLQLFVNPGLLTEAYSDFWCLFCFAFLSPFFLVNFLYCICLFIFLYHLYQVLHDFQIARSSLYHHFGMFSLSWSRNVWLWSLISLVVLWKGSWETS